MIIDTLNQLGQRIFSLLGEPDLGFNPLSKKERVKADSLFEGDALAKLLPYESYDEQNGIFYTQHSMGFVLEAVPIVGADEAVEKEIGALFEEILEEGDSLQCLLLADHRVSDYLDKWKKVVSKASDVLSEMRNKRSQHLNSVSRYRPKVFRFILSYSIPYNEASHAKDLLALIEKKKSVLKTLSLFTYAFSWNATHFLSHVGGLLNFDLSTDRFYRKWNPFESLSTQFGGGGELAISEQQLIWKKSSEAYFKSFRILDFPETWSLHMMHMLIGDSFRDAYRIQDPFYLHFGVHCPKQSKEEGSFWRKSQLIENQGKSGTLIRLIPELGHELGECHQIRGELNKGAKFVWTQFSAGVWAPKESFVQACQSLKSLFRINQFQAVENTSIHLPHFLSSLPMLWGEYIKDLKELSVLRTTLSTECKNLVPVQGEWMGTPNPGMLLLGRRGQLLNWNPFDSKSGNYNIVVSGRSGSGKSVFMQDLLFSGLSQGARVYVLDVGRSFEKMCDFLDGQKIEFSGGNKICLNPFTHVPLEHETEREDSFSFLKSIIGCMAAPTAGITDYQNAWIEKGIQHAWEAKKNKATITDVSEWLLVQDDQTAKELGVVLVPFTKQGVYSKYFEGENNIDFNNPMVLIELEEIKDKKDLQAVVLQLFVLEISNHAFMGDRKTPFYICIDEAWDLLRSKQMGVFIETLARRLRKYHGSLVIGTQSIEDFFVTPGAHAAYQNSDWMCFLSQKKSSITAWAKAGKLDIEESKVRALESVSTQHGEYSEVMIIDGDKNFSIARLILDPFSNLLYSTRAQDHSNIETLKKRGMSVAQAINALLDGNHVG